MSSIILWKKLGCLQNERVKKTIEALDCSEGRNAQ